jgi:hypothetical protein
MDLSYLLSKSFLIIQLLSCVAAIFYWKNYKNTHLWIFLPLLLYTAINEVSIQVLMKFDVITSPRIFYNVYSVISFLAYLYWFDKILNLKYWKWIVLVVFLTATTYDLFQVQQVKQLFKVGLITQAIAILSFSVAYFSRLLNEDRVIHYWKIPEFWFILGLLTFYIGFTPLLLMTGLELGINRVYAISINILNLILYGCYIIGFYVTAK